MSLQGFYTTKGLALAAKIAAGTKLTVTKAVAGSGTTDVSASVLADIEQTLTVGTAKVAGQTATLPVTLAESGAAASYTLTELGVYASDPDEGEILFQVFRLGESRAITAGGESMYRFYLRETVGASGVTVTCSPAGLLVEEDLEPVYASLAKKPDAVQTVTVIHVAKTGSDTTGDGSESNPYLTIQKAVNSLPKLIPSRAQIQIHEGLYDEAVTVEGVIGGDSLQLIGDDGGGTQVKNIRLVSNNCRFLVSNIELVGTGGSSYNWSLQVSNTWRVDLQNVTCVNSVESAYVGAFYFLNVPIVTLSKCTISNKPVALDIIASTVYLNTTVTGENNTVGIRCGSGWGNYGGYVQKGGATIAGEEQKGFGGQIW